MQRKIYCKFLHECKTISLKLSCQFTKGCITGISLVGISIKTKQEVGFHSSTDQPVLREVQKVVPEAQVEQFKLESGNDRYKVSV